MDISEQSPRSCQNAPADRFGDQSSSKCETLQNGASWPDNGTRELLEHPYVIVYRVDAAMKAIVVQAIIHGARQRSTLPTSDED